jgi:hypothetical protein
MCYWVSGGAVCSQAPRLANALHTWPHIMITPTPNARTRCVVAAPRTPAHQHTTRSPLPALTETTPTARWISASRPPPSSSVTPSSGGGGGGGGAPATPSAGRGGGSALRRPSLYRPSSAPEATAAPAPSPATSAAAPSTRPIVIDVALAPFAAAAAAARPPHREPLRPRCTITVAGGGLVGPDLAQPDDAELRPPNPNPSRDRGVGTPSEEPRLHELSEGPTARRIQHLRRSAARHVLRGNAHHHQLAGASTGGVQSLGDAGVDAAHWHVRRAAAEVGTEPGCGRGGAQRASWLQRAR